MNRWNSLSDQNKSTRFTYQHHIEETLTDQSLNKYWKGYDNCKTECAAEQDLIQQFIKDCTSSFEWLKKK